MKPDPDFDAYHRRHAEAYQALNYDRSLSAVFMRKSHALIEKPFGAEDHFPRVVEVGAGSGQHVAHVRHRFDTYCMTDRSTEMLERARARCPAGVRARIQVAQEDATALSFPDGHFDRLIATHVLEHLYHPHAVLREWDRVVRPGGVLSIVLPCDPGLMWRFGRMLGPRASAERAGIAYDYWMAREHVNPINNLVVFIRYYFEDVQESWYPTRLPFSDLNLFYACNIRKR
jgi:phosphatidylethanolamine/phosphatidyl-N-methylethanolamine N-methyltransferase